MSNQVCNTVMLPVEEYEALRRERDVWKDKYENHTIGHDEWYEKCNELAASQAREQLLREALEWLLRQMPEPSLPGIYTDGYRKAKEALEGMK